MKENTASRMRRATAIARRFPSKIRVGWSVALALVACFRVDPAVAQESGRSWKSEQLSGTYSTQQEALAAVQAKGGWFQYMSQIKARKVSETEVRLTYAIPSEISQPQPWQYIDAGFNGSLHGDSEAAITAAIKADFDKKSIAEGCSANTVVTRQTEWEVDGRWSDGLSAREQAFFKIRWNRLQSGACAVGDGMSFPIRARARCSNEFLSWKPENNICSNENEVATLISQPLYCDSCTLVGDPIDFSTGDQFETETDIDLSWIDFTRYYHSATSNAAAGFGHGWTHSHDIRLAVQSGDPPTLGLMQANGSHLPFRHRGTHYEAVDGSGDRIVAVGSNWVLQQSSGSLTFNATGQLLEQRGDSGEALTYGYDALDRLTAITHSAGRSLSIVYSGIVANAPIASISSAGTVLASYTYTTQGQVQAVTYPGGGVRTYHYESANFPQNLTGISIEGGERYSTFAYDAQGRSISAQLAGGVDGVTVAYSAQGGAVVTDALGNATDYHLNTGGAADKPRKGGNVVDSKGIVVRTYYDDATDFRRRLKSVTDRNNITTEYNYAEANDPVTGQLAWTRSTTEATGLPQQRTSEERHDSASNRVILSKLGNRETRITRNARLQPVTTTVRDTVAGVSRTTTMSYCEAADVAASGSVCPILGLLKSVDGPRTDVSDVVRFEYYGSDDSTCATTPALCTHRKGDLRKTIDPLGNVNEVLGYDPQGRPLSVADANGVVTDYEYSPRGWLTAQKLRGPDNAVETDDLITRIEHFPTGLVKQVTLPDGNFTAYAYDTAQRLTSITDRSGATIQYALDLAGNRKTEDFKNGSGSVYATVSRVFNALGQLQTHKDGLNNVTGFTYDAQGRQDTTTDALGRVSDNDYDPLGRLVRSLQDAGTGRINAETRLEYDALDQVTKVIDPKGLPTAYARNALGDLTQLTSPDTGVTQYTYDVAGNVKTRTDARNITATYSYDALGRMTQQAYPTAVLGTTYTYDVVASGCPAGETFSKGRLSQSAGTGGALRYCYDRFGRMVRKIVQATGPLLTLRYAYTAAGALKSVTYPDGTVADYVRGNHGRITQIGVTRPGAAREILITAAGYVPYGPTAGWVYGNGRPMTRNLDRNYAVSKILGSSADGLSLFLIRDAAGNVSRLSNADQTTILARYQYDRLNRLTQTQDGPTGTALESYAYDAIGNRTSVQDSAGTRAYVYPTPATSHRLQSVGGIARGYDAAGNTTSIGGTAQQFVYNDLGRMSQVKADGVAKMFYAYNGDGQQVRRFNSTRILHSIYAEDGRWLGEYGDTGVAHQQIVWLDDLPVGLIQGAGAPPKLLYIEPDHLGSPRVVIDPGRNKAVWKWDVKGEAFGNSPPNEDPDLDGAKYVLDMRFPGQRFDAASGLNYNYFRDYDPVSGRYMQSDPIGQRAGVGTFAYVGSNPIGHVDPWGLMTICVDGKKRTEFFEYPGYIQVAASFIMEADSLEAAAMKANRVYSAMNAEYQQSGVWTQRLENYRNAEHYMFALDWADKSPGIAQASLAVATPAYSAYKAIFGRSPTDSPASVAEVMAGYKGVSDSISLLPTGNLRFTNGDCECD